MGFLQRSLVRLGIYHHIRHTQFGRAWIRRRNPDYFADLDRDEKFYRRLMSDRPCRLIFDVGANIGEKAEVFLRFAERVVCVEPDPACLSELRTRFRGDRRVVVEPTAVGEEASRATLHQRSSGSPFNTLSDKRWQEIGERTHTAVSVPMATLDHLIATHGVPDLLKIDIEGYELAAMRGLSQPVSAVCFEAILPAFADETAAIVARFDPETTRFNARNAFDYQLLFPDPVPAEALLQVVRRPDTVIYDIIALRIA